MAQYYQALIRVPEGTDITDSNALLALFDQAVQGMTGQQNLALAAVFVQGFADVLGNLVSAFAATQGYAASGTRTHDGTYHAHIVTTWTGQSLDFLCMLLSGTGQNWTLVAHQPMQAAPTGATRTVEELNELGQVVGTYTLPLVAVTPYRSVPQSILPWLVPDYDEQGNEVPLASVDGSRIGVFMGYAPWVVEPFEEVP